MRNLKKALSLVLATAMLLSMFVISAGAVGVDDFGDKNEITNVEAVSLLNALGLIGGDSSGNFNPDGTLTRAEMCKLVCLALNGGKDPVIGVKDVPTFKDIDNHWAEAYIEYCYSAGIIGGNGDGTFNPNGALTGVAAAKMMLTAMNYDATIFGFGGADWELNVGLQANQAGLYDGIEGISPSQPIARDDAAQLVYNAIQAPTMSMGWNIDPSTGEWTQRLDPNGKSLLADKFKAGTSEGQLQSISYNKDKAEYTYTLGGTVTHDLPDGLTARTTFPSTVDYSDLIGMNVKVIWTMDKANNVVVYGIFASDSNVIATGVFGDLKVGNTAWTTPGSLTPDAKHEFKLGDATYEAESSAAITIKAGYGNSTNTSGSKWNTVKLLDTNGNGRVDMILVLPVYVAKVAYVGTSSVSVTYATGTIGAPAASIPAKNNEIYDGIAKDDLVLVYTNAKGETVVEKADTVSGYVSEYNTGNSKLCVNGTWYALGDSSVATPANAPGQDVKTAAAYNGYLFFVDVSTKVGADNFALVTDVEASVGFGNTYRQVALLMSDGTVKTVFLDNVTANDSVTKVGSVGKLYKFSVGTKNGVEVYTLTAASDATVTAGVGGNTAFDVKQTGTDFSASSGSTPAKLGSYEIADDAVIFVYQNVAGKVEYKVISGKELKDSNLTAATVTEGSTVSFASKNANGFTYVTMAGIEVTAEVAASANSYAYAISNSIKNVTDNKTTYTTVAATADGEVTLVSSNTALTKGTVYKYANDNGTYKAEAGDSMSSSTTGYVAVTAYDGKYIAYKVGGTGAVTTKELDKNVQVIYVNAADGTVAEGDGSISLATETITSGTYFTNAIVVLNSAGDKVVAVVVDVNNDFQGQM